MSIIKEVLRLKYHNKLSNRQIQTMTGVSRSSVANYVKSFTNLQATLEEVLSLSDTDLMELLTDGRPKTQAIAKISNTIHPDWNSIREELSKKGMTRALLYEEFKSTQENVYSYSQFNRYYNKFLKSVIHQ